MGGLQVVARESFIKKLEKGSYKVSPTNCYCGVKKDFLIANKDRYGIPLLTVMCMNCGLVRSNPYYTKETLSKFYENEYRSLYSGSNAATEDFFDHQISIGRSIINYLEKKTGLSLNGKKVFEIGTGAGGILKAFKELGADVYGCDYGTEYLKRGASLGIKIVKGDSSSLEKFGKADLIVLNHILEHFLDIDSEITRLSKLLNSNGLVYISVPGLKSHIKTYGSLRNYLQNAHYYSFSLDSLTYLMGKFGYELVVGDEKIRAIFSKRSTDDGEIFVMTSAFQRFCLYFQLKISYLFPTVPDLYSSLTKITTKVIGRVKSYVKSS